MNEFEPPSLEQLKKDREFWLNNKNDPDFSIIAVGIIDDAIKEAQGKKVGLPSLAELEALRRYWTKNNTEFSKTAIAIIDDIKFLKKAQST